MKTFLLLNHLSLIKSISLFFFFIAITLSFFLNNIAKLSKHLLQFGLNSTGTLGFRRGIFRNVGDLSVASWDFVFPLARWSSISQWAERGQLSLPGFYWSVRQPNPWRRRAVLPICTGTNTDPLETLEHVEANDASCCFSTYVYCVSTVMMVLSRMAIGWIPPSLVSTHLLLCASFPSFLTTMPWGTACHGNNLFEIHRWRLTCP